MLKDEFELAQQELGIALLDEDALKKRKKEHEDVPFYIDVKERYYAAKKRVQQIREKLGTLALQIFEQEGNKTITDSVTIREKEITELVEDEKSLIEWCVQKGLLGLLKLNVDEFIKVAPILKPEAVETRKQTTYAISNKKLLAWAENQTIIKEEHDQDLGF